jgi:hypothetical protein
MMNLRRPSFYTAMALLVAIAGVPAAAGEWTQPVEVRHDEKLVMTYRAMWDGDLLLVRAALEPDWHTFVMDNKQRQQEKLAGKPSLGIEKSTEISVTDGLDIAGPWLQSAPKDFSKPEIRWYTWGFEREAAFAAKARKTGSGPARVEVRGQACAADICKNIHVTMAVPLTAGKPARRTGMDLNSLVPVRAD